MRVWIVSLEWNLGPAEVTGDDGIRGVYDTEAAARTQQRAVQREFDGLGSLVAGYSMGEGRFCIACGEPEHDADGKPHVCTNAGAEDFCEYCGAELTDHKTCDNDHDEWTVDVHCHAHTVVQTAVTV